MNKGNRACPVCTQNGKESTLELRQINLYEAVYICEDRNCIYPIGFQWNYVKNNILEDSDDSSDENSIKISDNCNKPELSKSSATQTVPKKNSINIITNIVIKNINTSETLTKSQKHNTRFVNITNKNKPQNNSIALPESVIKNAKALSKYFSSEDQQPEKPKRKIKSVFDIIQQSTVSVQKETKNKSPKKELTNKLNEHNYSIQQSVCDDEVTFCLDKALNTEEHKINNNNDLSATFDDLLFNDEDKCDKNQSLDLSEMDEFLSFL